MYFLQKFCEKLFFRKRIMNTRRPFISTTTWTSEKESGESNVEEITTSETTTTEFATTFRPPTVTFYPGLVVQRTTLKNSFTIPYTTTVRYVSTTPEPVLDYCKLLNCDFNGKLICVKLIFLIKFNLLQFYFDFNFIRIF